MSLILNCCESDKLESVVLEILRLQLPFQYLIKAVLTVNLYRQLVVGG